ncbi:hypothetical protein F2P79_021001 [Pimephales promelas]|nr:hypothetical protein F2P79_021001 [Pimephales promelas]
MCLDHYIQSSEAELWDVWTDIDCNDGLLLMDSITPAADCPGSSGGRPYWYPPPLGAPLTHSHNIHSYRGDLAGIKPATSEPVRQRSYL